MSILPKNPCFINQIELNFAGNRYNAASFVKNNSNQRHGWLAIARQTVPEFVPALTNYLEVFAS